MSACIKILATINLLIGLTCLTVQIISYANGEGKLHTDATSTPYSSPAFNEEDLKVTSGYTPTVKPPSYSNYHAGIWGGVIFILAGIATFRYAYLMWNKPSKWSVVVTCCVLSVGCGIALIVISGVNLSTWKKFGDCLVNPNECSCEHYFEGNFCGQQVSYNAVYIASGIVAIINNIVLLLAICFISCLSCHACH